MSVIAKRGLALATLVAIGLASAGLAGEDSDVARLLEVTDPIATHDAWTTFTDPHVVSCMEARGYDGFVFRPGTRADLSAADPTDDLIGFGVSLVALEAWRLAVEVWSLSPEAQHEWLAERQPGFDLSWPGKRSMQAVADARDCEVAAREAFVAMRSKTVDPDIVDRFERAVAAEGRRDPDIAAGAKEWVDCMAAKGHHYSSVDELQGSLLREFDRNHVYTAGVGLPDVERLQRQLDAIADFRQREITLGRASDMCSTALWEAKTALRERIAATVLAEAEP